MTVFSLTVFFMFAFLILLGFVLVITGMRHVRQQEEWVLPGLDLAFACAVFLVVLLILAVAEVKTMSTQSFIMLFGIPWRPVWRRGIVIQFHRPGHGPVRR